MGARKAGALFDESANNYMNILRLERIEAVAAPKT